jgi:hypothetical protein
MTIRAKVAVRVRRRGTPAVLAFDRDEVSEEETILAQRSDSQSAKEDGGAPLKIWFICGSIPGAKKAQILHKLQGYTGSGSAWVHFPAGLQGSPVGSGISCIRAMMISVRLCT